MKYLIALSKFIIFLPIFNWIYWTIKTDLWNYFRRNQSTRTSLYKIEINISKLLFETFHCFSYCYIGDQHKYQLYFHEEDAVENIHSNLLFLFFNVAFRIRCLTPVLFYWKRRNLIETTKQSYQSAERINAHDSIHSRIV